jgi:hypothetical protein
MEKLKIIVDDKGKVKIFMDEREVYGARRIRFEFEVGDIATHEIEFISHIAKT